jgi:dienelactone hydrolase
MLNFNTLRRSALRLSSVQLSSVRIAIYISILASGVSTNSISAAEPGSSSIRLSQFNLLQYRNADGEIHDVDKPEHWALRKREIIQAVQQVMGKMPGQDRRVSLAIEIDEEVDAGSYIRKLISFQSEKGSRTPAYLCIPKSAISSKTKVPAVLCLHPTDNTVGHKVVVGLGGREGRAYAAELAERGYVTIAPAYPHLANYWPNLGKLGYSSGSMKAIWDNTRALDLLDSLEYVDNSKGYGAIGHSLGGHNAIYTAALEPRITVVASSCGFDAFLDYYDGAQRNWFFGKGWCQIRYMPRMSNYRDRLNMIPFDFPELIGVLAPRPLFVNAPLHDSNFRWKSVDKCAEAAGPIYKLLDAKDNLIIKHPDSNHNFPAEMREEAYLTIDSVLKTGE